MVTDVKFHFVSPFSTRLILLRYTFKSSGVFIYKLFERRLTLTTPRKNELLIDVIANKVADKLEKNIMKANKRK